jgi:membrane fusion protein, multidrug efflux system
VTTTGLVNAKAKAKAKASTTAGRRLPAVTLLVLGASLAAGCKRPEAGGPGARAAPGGSARGGGGGRRPPKFPVEAQPVTARAVEYAVNAVGSLEAFETVQVTARVPGAVERVRFAEGQRVATGAVLVEVEPQRYKLAVDAARAALDKTRAAEADARAGLERREKAVAATPGLIPGEEIESWRTRVYTAQADAAEKKAALAQAQLNLRDAYVRAPVPGIIETRRVQTGQYVQPGVVMATLVRQEPLLLRFNVPAPEAAALRPGMTARFTLRDQRQVTEARITHVSQAADSASRMVAVTANVSGSERAGLRPGAFAEVVVPIGDARPAPVIPQTAVRPTERGFVAYVVEGSGANQKVRERILTLGLRTTDGAVEVKNGIAPGELVVVRGSEALREGFPVEVEKQRPGAADGPAPGGRPAQTAEKLGP